MIPIKKFKTESLDTKENKIGQKIEDAISLTRLMSFHWVSHSCGKIITQTTSGNGDYFSTMTTSQWVANDEGRSQ